MDDLAIAAKVKKALEEFNAALNTAAQASIEVKLVVEQDFKGLLTVPRSVVTAGLTKRIRL